VSSTVQDQSLTTSATPWHFACWSTYWGRLTGLHDVVDPAQAALVTHLYGFENVSDPSRSLAIVPEGGACFGYVLDGTVEVADLTGGNEPVRLAAGMWWSSAGGVQVALGDRSRAVVAQRIGFLGIRTFGGPIEAVGRLRYIDRCSDTLLVPPPLLGDPCLNHLHFPPGIEQSEHTHPSVRAGAVARGLGWCDTPDGRTPLEPGSIFCIPADGRHRFVTDGSTLDVIAYHPDSDWGPTDQDHPMINRTWVDGEKIDNSCGVHLEADVVGR